MDADPASSVGCAPKNIKTGKCERDGTERGVSAPGIIHAYSSILGEFDVLFGGVRCPRDAKESPRVPTTQKYLCQTVLQSRYTVVIRFLCAELLLSTSSTTATFTRNAWERLARACAACLLGCDLVCSAATNSCPRLVLADIRA